MQPETALDSWRQWSCELDTRPVILKSLSGGLSNRSFLLDSDGKKMVLRLNGKDSLLPNANRSYEVDIWQAASKQGIAPSLLYVDKITRYLVSSFIDNSVAPQPPHGELFIDQALSLLKCCHQLDVNVPVIDYVSHIEQYWQIINTKPVLHNPALNEQREPMQKVLDKLLNSNTATGLCHHDPVAANFVGNPNRLYLIDWEYAAHGLLVMDYAALGVEWEIDDSILLTKTGIEPELLIMAKLFYKYLYALWEEATA